MEVKDHIDINDYLSQIDKPAVDEFAADMPSTFAIPESYMTKYMTKPELDPNGKLANAPGAKLDMGKVRPWLCIAGFSRALEEVSKVTTLGAQKYTPNGWSSVPDGVERYMDAFGRHMLAEGRGEVFDEGINGTGCRHKAQMVWNLLASLELELREKDEQQ
jgi:hypothetical protein